MVQVHDILTPVGGAPMKVIWRDWSQRALVTVDQDDPKSWPEVHDWTQVEDDVKHGLWAHGEGTPPSHPADHQIPQNHRDKRDADWAVIGPLVLDPAIFAAKGRARLIGEAAEQLQVSTRSIRNKLLKVFHGGMDAGALLPAWDRIGNRGVPRLAPDDAPKRGRPAKEGKFPGVNVTSEMRKMFLAWADTHRKNGRVDLQQTYEDCMRGCFIEEVKDLQRSYPRHIPLAAYAEAGLPRYEQFCYWVNKDTSAQKRHREKIGERLWALKHRGLTGDSTKEAWAPGARFQIDATVIDVYIRSKRDRKRVLGRATLYVVIDVFSRMIVGFSLSLSPPSWANAMMAIASCVEDKVALCARFGITITEQDWPCRILGAIIEGDRAEMENAKAVPMIESLGPTVENAAAYRADWKGIVESRFRLLQASFRPFVPGYVEKNFRERGARDYRLDAKLDLDALTKVVIHQILAHNNYNQIRDYPAHPGMAEAGVPAVPREMWNWGIPALGGLPRQHDEAKVRFALMHRREAVVHRNGIYHQGAWYTCEKALREGWFEKARKKRFKVWISFDDRNADVIYVHDRKSELGFQVAHLTDGSQHRAGMSFWDLADLLDVEDVIADRQRVSSIAGRADHDAATNRIVHESEAAMEGVELGSDASQVNGIRAATSEERLLDRAEEAADYHQPMLEAAGIDLGHSAATSSLIDIHLSERTDAAATERDHQNDPQQAPDDYRAPSMKERRQRMKETTNA